MDLFEKTHNIYVYIYIYIIIYGNYFTFWSGPQKVGSRLFLIIFNTLSHILSYPLWMDTSLVCSWSICSNLLLNSSDIVAILGLRP